MAIRISKLTMMALSVATAFAQEYSPPAGPYRLPLKPIDQNHTYSASTTGPIGNALSKSNAAKTAVNVITRHFENEAERVYKLLQTPPTLFIENLLQACNLPDDFSQVASVNMTTSSYGWGVMGKPCTTELVTSLDAQLELSMKTYIAEVKKVAMYVIRSVGFRWPKAVTYMEFKYKGDFESCTLLHFTAFRVNGTWGINTGITNDDINIFKEERHRHYLVEVLHSWNNSLYPTRFTLPRHPPARGWVHESSTLHATWGGSPSTSLFRTIMGAANNPAVVAAISVGHDTKEQAQDATTKSNMAILILPLMLAIIPVALFADVSTFATVGYAIITDVMSAMPLAIKGMELMNFGYVKQIATRTWIYGGRSRNDLTGQIFLAVSLMLMLVGGALEIYFKQALERRKKKQLESSIESLQQRPQLWEYSSCKDCDCMNEHAGEYNSK